MTPEEGRPVPYTVAPRLRDPDAALRILEQHHPPLLKAAGVTGQVLIRDYVDSTGHVHRVEIVQGSGIEGLDRTARASAERFEFTPALNTDRRVSVWSQQLINFEIRQVERPPAASDTAGCGPERSQSP